MSDLVKHNQGLPAMNSDEIEKVQRLEDFMRTMPQVDIETVHTIHGGTYTRTIMIPAGVILAGALIKIPTTLIVCGHVTVFIGDRAIKLEGYNVIPASAGRKQAFTAHSDTWLTMIFPTTATSIEQAEEEFTAEAAALGSRWETSRNIITITGE